MFRKLGMIMAVGFAALCVSAGVSIAGETDLLVQKLVEKGVLSPNEAQILLDETKQDVARQNAKGTNDAIPQWVQNIKVKGDTRLRFESIRDKGVKDLTHERLRVRLGVESKVNDQMKVGIGLATGKPSDPRSRNISLGNGTDAYGTTGSTGPDNTAASAKNFELDYAYAEYTPVKWATIIGGKFQNPLWSPWDMIWKGDITPEGAAVKLNYNLFPGFNVFMNDLAFVLRNPDSGIKGRQNAAMFASQIGSSWDIANSINLKSALTYYKFEGIQGQPRFSYSVGGNTATLSCTQGATASSTCYNYNYDALSPSAEIGFKNPFGESVGAFIPYAAVFGDYIYNVSGKHSSTGRGGFDTGVKLGYEKVADKNQYTLKLATSKIGANAWLDAFTDSDRYKKGYTNTQSYEGILEYGLGKSTSLSLDYYYSFQLDKQSSGNRMPEQLYQIDWNLKF
ncbi:MAG: putative porin [Candidatus Omnitrophica bacterium]|nr:putative porin [Candidatus Omnitrophota bacterium]